MNMYLPQLALSADTTSLERFITNDEWVIEQKLDGHRILLCSSGGDYPPSALTRNGTAYTRRLPQEIQNFRFPPTPDGRPMDWILDGELVDGTFWVFDMPRWPGDAESNLGLAQRRAVLETLMENLNSPFKLVPQARTAQDKITLAKTAIASNFEGLIVKRANAKYLWGGRTADWMKIKFVTTADVVVTGVRLDGKESVNYCVFDETTGKQIDVGRASLIGKEKRGAINVGDVIEVKYLYVGADGRLYQPTVVRKRDDKRPDECTTVQLKMVNKQVLDSIA